MFGDPSKIGGQLRVAPSTISGAGKGLYAGANFMRNETLPIKYQGTMSIQRPQLLYR